ncbi:complement C3-like, partial [Neolamprologus brichardi]|uniref:complement C3-like n=1 Tax=Neolamprologus brichardi TaxID=32507 RepID=UPI001643833F
LFHGLRYLFGQEVDGTAYVVFGVIKKDQSKQSFPDSLQRVQIENGEGEVRLRREDITKVERDINSLVGGAIFVSVSVLTESGSEMVEAELRGIQIVTSPYTIHFKRTPKYFKPGMSFDVALQAMTDDRILTPDKQARAEMTARPYQSKTRTFIHIGVDAAELKIGDNLKINLNLNQQPNQNHDITYLIQSRGQLVKHGRYKTRGQVLISLIQPITKEMLPSFRIIAYYHTSSNEVVPLQDSITTWQFTGISLSRTHGICVGDPFEVIVKKDFFIDLRLPYSAVRGEQIEIKAILHNYSPDLITVRIELTEEEHVCSSASKRGKYRQEVTVGPETTRSVPFVIIPMKEGERRIEVKAAVKDSYLNDGIMKMLRVVPEGVLVKHPKIVTLDPVKKGENGVQNELLNSGIQRKDLVPNTPTSTQISVTGREQVSQLVENAIGGNSMGTLIRQPSGCGEQNMISMTLPVIATLYLDKTNQWETVGFEKRNEALQHIKTGYTNELAFRKNDGSFAAFVSRPASTWLTAYVAKVFAMAHHLVAIQDNVICDAVKYLILRGQQPDGVFKEFTAVIHGEMNGDVAGLDSDASMTAFCLIAMQESRSICSDTVNSLPGSIDKAVAYLERRLPSL